VVDGYVVVFAPDVADVDADTDDDNVDIVSLCIPSLT